MIEKKRKRLERVIRQQDRAEQVKPEPEPEPEPKPVEEKPRISKIKALINKEKKPDKKKKVEEKEPVDVQMEQPGLEASDYQLPPLSLLQEIKHGPKAVQTTSGTTSRILVDTLSEFGIETEVVNVERGPVVTRYELLPAPGIRVERISGLANNLALALKATSVRVQAPIPGKGVVGIEVPNSTAKVVYLKEILESEMWQSGKIKVPLVLGQDVGGNVMVADLADMPHMLIAGATGAGKTVCMNSILAGLLMARKPSELKLMLVDPKIVEFSVYNNLPHLVVPVITNPKKVALGLRWAINEMEKRYKLFAKVGVRNIASYNNREIATQEELFHDQVDAETKKDEPPATVPYIVIVIDELADLMLADQAEIENCVARLAQLSRAVGIHMILSTQRPSVNVITGTIKANFPARIAFQVAQKVDSRTILDTVGADKLLGSGDMLFLPPGTSKVVRAQGALTSDEDIRQITDFIKQQATPDYNIEIKEKIDKKGPAQLDDGEEDELLGQAVEIIKETRRASTSSLQRRLRIGYTRAARMMDILEERGIIGPPRGSDPREILIDLDGEIPDNPIEEQETVSENTEEEAEAS
jgi:S-DNA-T family DNA segregation ATPase FtsK/SpoIIIE